MRYMPTLFGPKGKYFVAEEKTALNTRDVNFKIAK